MWRKRQFREVRKAPLRKSDVNEDVGGLAGQRKRGELSGPAATMDGPKVGMEGRPVWLEQKPRKNVSRGKTGQLGRALETLLELWVSVFCVLGSLKSD